jgi:hypothetical protein
MRKISTKNGPYGKSNLHADYFKGGLIILMYMDIHKNLDGLTAEVVIQVHQQDLETQGQCGVNYLK